jgi:hypothetical protein
VGGILSGITLKGVIAGIIIGIVLAPQLSRVPGLDRIPAV